MFWERGGGANVQRLKVRSINISPQIPRKENNTYNLNKQIWGGGRGRIQNSTYVGIKIYLNQKYKLKLGWAHVAQTQYCHNVRENLIDRKKSPKTCQNFNENVR